MHFLGIDIAQKSFQAALLNPQGKFRSRTFPNTCEGFVALQAWLAQSGATEVRVAMEATGGFEEPLAIWLHDQGVTVSVVNPMLIKNFANSAGLRAKTDKVDAKIIARFIPAMNPRPWSPDPKEIRHLRALLRRIKAMEKMQRQELNRALHPADKVVKQLIQDHVSYLERAIQQLWEAVFDHIRRHPALREKQKLLISIPGINKVSSAWLLGEIPFHRLRHARQAAAFAGIVPYLAQSGTSLQNSRISKRGNRQIRGILYMPAIVARQWNPAVKALAQRLESRNKHGKAITVAAIRKLIHIAFGVIKSGQPFDPKKAGVA